MSDTILLVESMNLCKSGARLLPCVTPPVQQLLLSDAAFSASNLMHFVIIYNLL